MLFSRKPNHTKRAEFRQALASGKLLAFPGTPTPFVALMIEQAGFDGVYVSGAGLSNELGLPDIGLTTLPEVVGRGRQIAACTDLPVLIDIDTGFGEPMSVVRTIRELEAAGIAGCHLEDQQNPKRCGHLDGKALVDTSEMVRKVKAAVDGKTDPNFLVIARTDARASEGLDKALDRAKAYVDAGAEMIFPEALQGEKEFEAFRKAVKVPLLANMTEFGKSKLLSTKELESLGYNLVIYPQTAFRLASKAIEDGLKTLKASGTQESLVPSMQTRARLYEILQYERYNAYDQNIFNFKV
mgnify:CR=1 FL=1